MAVFAISTHGTFWRDCVAQGLLSFWSGHAEFWTVAVEQFIIEGDLMADSFLPWIVRHMKRLGLQGAPLRRADGQVEITLSGPTDLIDAMELGVSLGPIDVWVDAIERRRLENGEAR